MDVLISIDPGDKYTGYTIITERFGILIESVTLDPQQLVRRLEEDLPKYSPSGRDMSAPLQVSRLLLEQFRIFPSLAKFKAWDKLRVVEITGIARYLGEKAGVKVVDIAQPDVKRFWAKRTMKVKTHSTHETSAYKQAMYVRAMYPIP